MTCFRVWPQSKHVALADGWSFHLDCVTLFLPLSPLLFILGFFWYNSLECQLHGFWTEMNFPFAWNESDWNISPGIECYNANSVTYAIFEDVLAVALSSFR